MNENIKEAYVAKMTAQLHELGARVDLVKARIEKGGADFRITYHTQLEDWQKREQFFKKELSDVSAASAEKFEAIKDSVQSGWNDLSRYVSEKLEKISDKPIVESLETHKGKL
jgi:hypothetical protein